MRDTMERSDSLRWIAAYRTPFWLAGLFVALLVLFAVTPDPSSGDTDVVQETSEPSPGPRECVVCPIDQRCDPGSGQCMFIEHTPLPCVKSARFDEEAGFCLPEGAPPPPAPAVTSDDEREPRQPRTGRSRVARQPRLPGFGND